MLLKANLHNHNGGDEQRQVEEPQ